MKAPKNQQPAAPAPAPSLSPLEQGVIGVIRAAKYDIPTKLRLIGHLLNGDQIASGTQSDDDQDATAVAEDDDGSDDSLSEGANPGAKAMAESLRHRPRRGESSLMEALHGNDHGFARSVRGRAVPLR